MNFVVRFWGPFWVPARALILQLCSTFFLAWKKTDDIEHGRNLCYFVVVFHLVVCGSMLAGWLMVGRCSRATSIRVLRLKRVPDWETYFRY